MKKMIIRLDDACERMDVEKWNRMEKLLDCYHIIPLVGIIPFCEDPSMSKYAKDFHFWEKTVQRWKKKGWELAMHGYNHVYISNAGGVNPINQRSEFAGVSYDIQKGKICNGYNILKEHGILPRVFFAPSHTFDTNTLLALKEASDIRYISDTIACKPYNHKGFVFVPQQSGKVRNLPFDTVTFCYHPNTMGDLDFENLENFIKNNSKLFIKFPAIYTKRKLSFVDKVIRFMYFSIRKIKKVM